MAVALQDPGTPHDEALRGHSGIGAVSSAARFAVPIVTLFVACTGNHTPGGPTPILVGAAASLQRVLPDLVAEYEKTTGRRVRVTYASSGALAAQISRGAPIDLFLSADDRWVQELARDGRVLPDSVRTYAEGRLALVACVSNGEPIVPRLSDLVDQKHGRIGIANPDLAPYGAAAARALEGAGVWSRLEQKVVRGENVGQVEKYCASGNVDLAFLPTTLAHACGRPFVEIDHVLHPALAQTLAVPRSASQPEAALAFAEFLATPGVVETLEGHGLFPPGSKGPDVR